MRVQVICAGPTVKVTARVGMGEVPRSWLKPPLSEGFHAVLEQLRSLPGVEGLALSPVDDTVLDFTSVDDIVLDFISEEAATAVLYRVRKITEEHVPVTEYQQVSTAGCTYEVGGILHRDGQDRTIARIADRGAVYIVELDPPIPDASPIIIIGEAVTQTAPAA